MRLNAIKATFTVLYGSPAQMCREGHTSRALRATTEKLKVKMATDPHRRQLGRLGVVVVVLSRLRRTLLFSLQLHVKPACPKPYKLIGFGRVW